MLKVAVAHAGSERDCPARWCRSTRSNLRCLGCYSSSHELLRRLPREQPNAVVVDAAHLDGSGPECVRALKQRLPQLGVIVLSDRKDAPAITAWLMAGAQGYLLKPAGRKFLEDAVERVTRGQMAFSPEAFLQILNTFNPRVGPLPECKLLSRRQRQILTYLAMDYEHKEIAPLLKLTPGTVDWYVRDIREKLGARNITAALRKFVGTGLFPAFNLNAPSGQPRPATPPVRSLRELNRRFHSEEACRDYLADLRWPNGFRCPYCGARRAWRMSRGLRLCEQCRRQVSVMSGTIFHSTRLPLTIWFRIAWELAVNNRLKPADLPDVVPLGGYKTAWTCLKKLRRSLGDPNWHREGSASNCGDRFASILRRALEMSPQPFRKLVTRKRRKVEQEQ
jgi:DNA-binding NarL/FixJ family response regulator